MNVLTNRLSVLKREEKSLADLNSFIWMLHKNHFGITILPKKNYYNDLWEKNMFPIIVPRSRQINKKKAPKEGNIQ